MENETVNIGLEDIAEVLAMTPGKGFIRQDLVSNLNERLKTKFGVSNIEAGNVIQLIESNGYITTGNEGVALMAGQEIEIYLVMQKGKELIKQYAKVK